MCRNRRELIESADLQLRPSSSTFVQWFRNGAPTTDSFSEYQDPAPSLGPYASAQEREDQQTRRRRNRNLPRPVAALVPNLVNRLSPVMPPNYRPKAPLELKQCGFGRDEPDDEEGDRAEEQQVAVDVWRRVSGPAGSNGDDGGDRGGGADEQTLAQRAWRASCSEQRMLWAQTRLNKARECLDEPVEFRRFHCSPGPETQKKWKQLRRNKRKVLTAIVGAMHTNQVAPFRIPFDRLVSWHT